MIGRIVAGALVSAGLSAGCVEPDPYRGPLFQSSDHIAELAIDTGARVELEPGSGLGLALEYLGDGNWWAYTSCDHPQDEAYCLFDILLISDESAGGIGELEGHELEPEDSVSRPDDFALALDFLTEDDIDGVGFMTEPGATVRVSALFYDPIPRSSADWSDDPRPISWVGQGALHWGSPTNPVDLTPDRP